MGQQYPRYGGYSPELVLYPENVPEKYICTFCNKIVKRAVQVPVVPKIVCGSCYEWNFQ